MSYTFTWGPGPSEVIVTGTFDNWSKSLPLIKSTTDGSFSLTVPLKTEEKILYKYVVDGEWVVSDHGKSETDEGITNNVLYPADLVTVTSSSSDAAHTTIIPESGLPIATTSTTAKEPELKTTVLPSSEGQQQTLGEPGIVVPKDAAHIDAFNNVSTVDAKALNDETPEIVGTGVVSSTDDGKTKKVKKSKKRVKKNGTLDSTDASEVDDSTVGAATEDAGHKTLDPAAETVVGVQEVSPEEATKLADNEQIVAVEEVTEKTDAPGATASEVPVAAAEQKPVKKTVASPATTTTKKTDKPVEKKKKGFFSKLKKFLD